MAKCSDECASVSRCDIFDFMANYVGMTVVHPGGFNATNELLNKLKIDQDSHIIDIACGKGTSALYIAKRYGCKVTAIDISPELIEEARHLASKRDIAKRVNFLVCDAMKLPFEENFFDAAISQAMLVLVDDKIQAIKEAKRVVKKGGTAGWLELSWKNEPTEEFLDYVSNVLCSYCMRKAETYEGWREVFRKAGVQEVEIIRDTFKNSGVLHMLKDEGLANTMKILSRYIGNSDVRKRMKLINAAFTKYPQYFGYGIYSFTKA
jgi:ubiquinone/menaquinone biosynthesis C-methylase UbiE